MWETKCDILLRAGGCLFRQSQIAAVITHPPVIDMVPDGEIHLVNGNIVEVPFDLAYRLIKLITGEPTE